MNTKDRWKRKERKVNGPAWENQTFWYNSFVDFFYYNYSCHFPWIIFHGIRPFDKALFSAFLTLKVNFWVMFGEALRAYLYPNFVYRKKNLCSKPWLPGAPERCCHGTKIFNRSIALECTQQWVQISRAIIFVDKKHFPENHFVRGESLCDNIYINIYENLIWRDLIPKHTHTGGILLIVRKKKSNNIYHFMWNR